jgi:hypothetical protein
LLLDPDEFLDEERPWSPLGEGEALSPQTLGFTYCGVPIVYHLVEGDGRTTVHWADGSETTGGDRLDNTESQALFARQGAIASIEVGVPSAALL